jgi:hypothetical protein
MHSRKSTVYFILLNITFSAITTLIVLWLWDSSKGNLPSPKTQPVEISIISPQVTFPVVTQVLSPTLPPIDQKLVRIENVFGVGDLQQEVVILKYVGDAELDLTGWQLKDGNNHIYIFSGLRVYKNSTIEIYSRAGPNNLTELNWNLDEFIWHSGDTVTLLDPEGNLRDSYLIQ